MEDLAKDVKMDAQEFIDKHKDEVKDFYEKGTFDRHYNDNYTTELIKKWNGQIIINGELTSKGFAIQQVAEFSQNLKRITGAVGFSQTVSFGKYGRELNISIPDISGIEDLDDYEDMSAFLESEGVNVYSSSGKGGK